MQDEDACRVAAVDQLGGRRGDPLERGVHRVLRQEIPRHRRHLLREPSPVHFVLRSSFGLTNLVPSLPRESHSEEQQISAGESVARSGHGRRDDDATEAGRAVAVIADGAIGAR
ncbi:hypothetical protein AB0F07_21900 [Streptomyces fructofermentans]|uniref:hypothetical protein n=1 Tax=Streptomyces fructofermentans TaxID=152141 RepID=UPI0033C16BE9